MVFGLNQRKSCINTQYNNYNFYCCNTPNPPSYLPLTLQYIHLISIHSWTHYHSIEYCIKYPNNFFCVIHPYVFNIQFTRTDTVFGRVTAKSAKFIALKNLCCTVVRGHVPRCGHWHVTLYNATNDMAKCSCISEYYHYLNIHYHFISITQTLYQTLPYHQPQQHGQTRHLRCAVSLPINLQNIMHFMYNNFME